MTPEERATRGRDNKWDDEPSEDYDEWFAWFESLTQAEKDQYELEGFQSRSGGQFKKDAS
jgi:hypothetical protein